MLTKEELKKKLIKRLGWPESVAEDYLKYLEQSNVVKDKAYWLKDSKKEESE